MGETSEENVQVRQTKKGLPLFARLIICSITTVLITLAEFLLSHVTHSITLLVVANHSFYNLLTLIFGAVSSAVSFHNLLMNFGYLLQWCMWLKLPRWLMV